MKRSTFMTEVATHVATQTESEAPSQRFTQWENHWGQMLSQPACWHFGTHSLGCTEHWHWQQGCQSCGEMPRWEDKDEAAAITVFQQMAHELGHWWATEWQGSTPVNLTELTYLNATTSQFGAWGYNPPMRYGYVVNQYAPWAVETITHRTARQSFKVTKNGVELDLTTTGDNPKVVVNTKWYKVDDNVVVHIVPGAAELQKMYRYNWLSTYLRLIKPNNVSVWDGPHGNVISENYEEWLATIPE